MSRFIFWLLCNIQLSEILYPDFFTEPEEGEEYVGEALLDAIEPTLRDVSKQLDLPYIRPSLSKEGNRLIVRSTVTFLKHYLIALTNMCRSSTNFVDI